MEYEEQICPFCTQKMKSWKEFTTDNLFCECPNCGAFNIIMNVFLNIRGHIELDKHYYGYQYSGAIRELNEKNAMPPIIGMDTYLQILDQVNIPTKPSEKLNKILMHIYKKTEYLYQDINIPLTRFSIGYAQHKEELYNLLKALAELNYIEGPETMGAADYKYHLTLSGFSKAERMSEITDSNQCFVALWFDDPIVDVFKSSITAAVKRAGYNALIILMKEYNEDITDHIIAEIRKSRFIIADFTGLRGGVYYEAGFAAGLGKQVIMTCRKDWFNTTEKVPVVGEGPNGPVNVKVDEPRNVHFDVGHMNFIVWEEGKELEQRLYDRIIATVL